MIRLGLLLYFPNTIIFQNPCNELINFARPEFRFAVILNSLRVDYNLFLREKKARCDLTGLTNICGVSDVTFEKYQEIIPNVTLGKKHK